MLRARDERARFVPVEQPLSLIQTADGQAWLRKWEATDTSFYPENDMYKLVQSLTKKNVDPPYIDIPAYLKARDEVEKWKDVYQRILIGQK